MRRHAALTATRTDTRGADEPQLDFVVAPVGGGGMMSGVSTAVTSLDKRIVVHGAEPAGE